MAPSIQRIADYLRAANTNINQLSIDAEVSQPALFRFMRGERKTLTETARQVLIYVENWHKRHEEAAGKMPATPQTASLAPIEDAIRARWPLNAQSVSLLAEMIAVVAPVLARGIDPNPR